MQILTTQAVVGIGFRYILETAPGPLPITTVGPEDEPDAEPDVVLYDVIKLHEEDGADLDYWVKTSTSVVIAIDRTLRPELGARARERGVEWGVTLGITPDELVTLIEEAIAGKLEDSEVAQDWEAGAHLGETAGLSPRESSILELVVKGHSNQEIAETLFLSINSVKTYIRSTYRKIGAVSRAQAVAWGIQQGFPVESGDLSVPD